MAALALVGITGMYLNQIRKHGVLGLIGYVVFAGGYLTIMCVAFTAAYVLPEVADLQHRPSSTTPSPPTPAEARSRATSERSGPCSRWEASPTWSAACCSASRCTGPASCPEGPQPCSPSPVSPPPSSPVMPDALYRLLAFPNGIAMIALGYSLWRVARTNDTTQAHQANGAAPAPVSSTAGVQ